MRSKSIINVVVYIIIVVIYIINVVNHVNNDVDYTFHQGEEKYSFPRVQLSRIPRSDYKVWGGLDFLMDQAREIAFFIYLCGANQTHTTWIGI